MLIANLTTDAVTRLTSVFEEVIVLTGWLLKSD